MEKKVLYIVAINLYSWAMSQMLPYDKVGMWHVHSDLYMNKVEEV